MDIPLHPQVAGEIERGRAFLDRIRSARRTVEGLRVTVPCPDGDNEIDLGGEVLTNGDGMLLEGSTLYVAQNRDNQIAVLELAEDLSSAALTDTLTSPDFDVPTTLADLDGVLYAVNARFGTEPTPETERIIFIMGLNNSWCARPVSAAARSNV